MRAGRAHRKKNYFGKDLDHIPDTQKDVRSFKGPIFNVFLMTMVDISLKVVSILS